MRKALHFFALVLAVLVLSSANAAAQSCGDETCTPGEEDCGICPQDCPCPSGTSCVNRQCQDNGPTCGDGTCTAGEEDCGVCPQDCPCPSGTSCVNRQCRDNGPTCGDGTCTAGQEDCGVCPQDCPCPSGTSCANRQCVVQPHCGDGTCNPGIEDCGTCPQDCPCGTGLSCVNRQCQPSAPVCGDHTCAPGAEDCGTCPQDCLCEAGSSCINRQCQPQAICGDGTCTAGLEDCGTCPGDCPCATGSGCFTHQCQSLPSCGDGVCQPGSEDCGICPSDCLCPAGTSCINRQCLGANPRCGDGACTPGVEDCGTCGQDCPCASGTACYNRECAGPQCGNASCAAGCALKPTFTVSKATPNANEQITLVAASELIDDPSPKWDLGNGVHLEGSVVQYRYPTAGSYPIVLTATDARCHLTQFSDPVTVTVSRCGDRFCDDDEEGQCTLDCGICERVGPCTPDACPPLTCTPLNDYTAAEVRLPTLLRCGGFAIASVTLRNTGSTRWTNGNGYALISTSSDAVSQGKRVDLPANVTVNPQEDYTFEFPLLAPTSGNGVAHTTWRMTDAAGEFGAPIVHDITYSQDNCLSGPPGGGVSSSSLQQVALDDGSRLQVYNISTYPTGAVNDLVLRADRSTKTDCTQNAAKGLIRGASLGLNTGSLGDFVVMSDYYIAWFDTTQNDAGPQPGGRFEESFWRGGQLAGLWSLNPVAKDFRYKIQGPHCPGWAHNELIPGSASPNGEMNFWDKYGPGLEQCLSIGCDTPTCLESFFCFRYSQHPAAHTWRILIPPTDLPNGAGVEFKFGGLLTTNQGSSNIGGGATIDSVVEYVCRPQDIRMNWKFASSANTSTGNLFVYGWTGYAQDVDDTCCDQDPATNTYPDVVYGLDRFYANSRDATVRSLGMGTACNGQRPPAFSCTPADERLRVNEDSNPLLSPQAGEWFISGEASPLPGTRPSWTVTNLAQPGTGDGTRDNPQRLAWDRMFSWNENAHDGTLGFGVGTGPGKATHLSAGRWYATELLFSTKGANTVAVTTAGDCAGSGCTVSFNALPQRPDVSTMSWSGCSTGVGSTLSCTRNAPGSVAARVDMTDGDGVPAAAEASRSIFASAYAVGAWGPCAGTSNCTAAGPGGCQTTGMKTRSVTSSGLTLEAAAAATPPASSEACSETVPGYAASYTSTYDANWACPAAGANGCAKNRLSYSPASFRPTAPDEPAPPPILYTTGFVAGYTATYDANWTCTASGPSGCWKNRLSYSATGFTATGPDAPVPASVIYVPGYATGYNSTYQASWNCTASGPNGCRKDRLSYSAVGYSAIGPGATVPDPVLYTTGHVASYSGTYETSWTCTASGANGCRKNLLSYAAVTFTATGPDAAAPPPALYTTGYIESYTSTYDSTWTCTASGTNGCRKNRLSYGASTYRATGPDTSVPPAAIYTYGYVGSWYVGGWSGCSASCGPGTQTRTVYANGWKAVPPDAGAPSTTQSCNYGSCTLTCYDYGLYRTWAECFAEWPYCDIRYRDDGAGGLIQCKHGYQ